SSGSIWEKYEAACPRPAASCGPVFVSGALDVDLCERVAFHLREVVRVPERANEGQLEDVLTVGKLRARSGRADESVPGEGEDARACAVARQVVERHRLALRRSGRGVKEIGRASCRERVWMWDGGSGCAKWSG